MEAETETKSAIKDGAIKKPKANFIVVKEMHKTEVVERNNETQEEVEFIHGLHIFSVVGLCILFSTPVILIPQHDAVQFPKYWYELLVTFSLTYPVQWTLLAILDNHFLLNIRRLASPKSGVVLALTPLLGFVLIYCGLYLFWTYKLGYNFPMPFACFISLLTFFPFLLTLWYLFPKEMRMNKDSRKRLTSFIWYILWAFFTNWFYNTLQIMLRKMPSVAQPIMALVLPLMRSLDAKILKTQLTKCRIVDDLVVEAYACIISNVNFLLYVTISISTLTNDLTTFCILLVDVLGNFYHCYGIIKLHRKVDCDDIQIRRRQKEKDKAIKILALSEVLEILVPLSYTISFIVAYYGPNATILRSVKNDYWGNSASGDIGAVLTTEVILFSADFSSLVVSIARLWYFCRINLLRHFCLALKKYWLLIAAIAGALISKVCLILYRNM